MRRARSGSMRPAVQRLTTLLGVIVVWELVGRYASGPRLPSASAVFAALFAQLQTAEFWAVSRITLEGLVWGFGISAAGGVALGLLVGTSGVLDDLSRPYLRIAVSIPLAPVVPILMVIFGFGTPVRVVTIVVFALPIIVEHTAAGVRSIEWSWLAMARSFGTPQSMLFKRIILPGSTPGVFAGLRLGVGRAVIGMVVAELIIVTVGLGGLLQRHQATFNPPEVFAIVIVFLFLGLVLVQGVRWLEDRVLHWR